MAIQSVTKSSVDIPYNPNERFNRGVLKNVIQNLSESEYERVIQLKEEYYKEYLHKTTLNRLVADILMQYSKTNRTVLVTNCREDRTFMTLNYYGLIDKFSDICYRQIADNETKINKYENAISHLFISANSVVAFENEKAEINFAIHTGILYENIISVKFIHTGA